MNRRILISENERSRILGLHENRRMKEWGLINEQEQTTQYYKDQTGKVIKLVGNYSVPLGSTLATPEEYAAQNPAPFKPNGYESVEACKTAYKTTYLSGVSMKVFGQPYTVIQKKWVDAKCNGKTPCDKSGAANTNLAMAICEGTFNMSGPVATPPASTVTTNTTTAAPTVNTGTTTASTVNTGTTTAAVIDTANLASRSDLRQQYRQGKRDVRELKKELNQYQNTLQRLGAKMTPEQKKQYETKIAQLQIQINQSAA